MKELCRDGRGTEVAGLRIPRDGGDCKYGGEQIVESSPLSGQDERPDKETESRSGHDAENDPTPITSPSSQMNIGVGWVDIESSITGAFEQDVCEHVYHNAFGEQVLDGVNTI